MAFACIWDDSVMGDLASLTVVSAFVHFHIVIASLEVKAVAHAIN